MTCLMLSFIISHSGGPCTASVIDSIIFKNALLFNSYTNIPPVKSNSKRGQIRPRLKACMLYLCQTIFCSKFTLRFDLTFMSQGARGLSAAELGIAVHASIFACFGISQVENMMYLLFGSCDAAGIFAADHIHHLLRQLQRLLFHDFPV